MDRPDDAAERRLKIYEQRKLDTGIDEAMIERLVRAFYGKVRVHPVLGPVFNEKVHDWEDHMRRLMAFWSSVVLASGAYAGTPMQKHGPLPVDGRHFDLWLRLFASTVAEVCPEPQARIFMERALRIAESLEMAIAGANGVILGKGERLRRPDADVFLPESEHQ